VEFHDIVLLTAFGENEVCCLAVLPQTLSVALQATCKQIVQDFEDNNGGPVMTIEEFYSVLKAYIVGRSMDNKCHDLVKSIRSAIKPDSMRVQNLFYQLKELNDYIEWLLGTETKLNDTQLNLGFLVHLLHDCRMVSPCQQLP
jgi:hypothetical protein